MLSGRPTSRARLVGLRLDRVGRRFDVERERNRQVLDDAQRARAATARSLTMPMRSTSFNHASLSAMAAVAVPRTSMVPPIGKRGAGDERGHHLGGRFVESEQRDLVAGSERQPLDAQRSQAVVVLDEGRRCRGRAGSRAEQPVDLVHDAAGFAQRVDFNLHRRHVAGNRAPGNRRMHDRRQHAGVDAGADDAR